MKAGELKKILTTVPDNWELYLKDKKTKKQLDGIELCVRQPVLIPIKDKKVKTK